MWANQLTISHAESGFMAENDVNDVWKLLFPSQDEEKPEGFFCVLIVV